MVQHVRARRAKLAPFGSGTESEEASSSHHQTQVRTRQENRRRAVLYSVNSASGKRLPSVSLQPTDARFRRDLLRITQQNDRRVENEQKSAYEDEQNDCKHREHLNFRPPLDQIGVLQDLHSTVAKDCRDRVKLSAKQEIVQLQQKIGTSVSNNQKTEWRLGYNNNIDTGSRAGVGRTFEPRDGIRERILDHRNASVLLPDSVAIAYPLKKSDFATEKIPKYWENDEKRLNSVEFETGTHSESFAQNNVQDAKKKPWCPAASFKSPIPLSPSTELPANGYILNSPEKEGGSPPNRLLRFPLRSVEYFELIEETEETFAVDARVARRQETFVTKIVDTYAKVRARIDRLKDPHLRYELPIQDVSQHSRGYRLGLSEIPSSKPKKGKQKPIFRPKSAGTSLGFQIGTLGPKSGDLLTPDPNVREKVAGARRRPHSANITYFKHSTVFCMGLPTPSKCVSADTDFRSVVALEGTKRQCERDAILVKLGKHGLLHQIPLAQVFARLRRESLFNIDRRLQRNVFERMTLDEYMNVCGCLNTTDDTSASRNKIESPHSASKEIKRFCANLPVNFGQTLSVDVSSSLIATRKALVVSRQQFHLALEPFNLSPADVNLFFSALDLSVCDQVQIWDAICTVEILQHEQTIWRRARMQQLQTPAKDLGFFRRKS